MSTALASVQEVAQELLGALNSHNTFNIICFGSNMQSLFVQPKPGDSLEKKRYARLAVEQISANYGSSELWKPLRNILQLQTLRKQEFPNKEISPSLILISDGQVTEPEYSLDLISQLCKAGVKTFPIGIGKSMNRYFLKQASKAGGGHLEFVHNGNEKLAASRQCKRANDLWSLSDVRITWPDDKMPSLISPVNFPGIFQGDRLLVFAFIDHVFQAELIAQFGSKEVRNIASTSDHGIVKGNIIHRLAAKSMIRDFTDQSIYSNNQIENEFLSLKMRDQMTQLALNYQLLSPWTSFVAIEERVTGEKASQNPDIKSIISHIDSLSYIPWSKLPIQERVTAVREEEIPPIERENLVKQIKIAEMDSNYEEAVRLLKRLSQLHKDLTVEERNLLVVNWKNNRLNYLSDIVSETDWYRKFKLRKRLEEFLIDCKEHVEKDYLPFTSTMESKVAMLKVQADTLRYLAEATSGSRRKDFTKEAHESYKQAKQLAEKELSSTHPVRLAVSLNYSVFLHTILKDYEAAAALGKQAFDDSIAELDTLDEDSYKDSTLIMQLLRDNLTLWTSSPPASPKAPRERIQVQLQPIQDEQVVDAPISGKKAMKKIDYKEKSELLLARSTLKGFATAQGGSFKSWKKRYYILVGTQLYQSKTPKDPFAKLLVDLANSLEVKPAAKMLGIEIYTKDRVFILTFESEEEQKKWLVALGAAMVAAKLQKNALRSSFGLFWTSSVDICKLLKVNESNILQELEQRGARSFGLYVFMLIVDICVTHLVLKFIENDEFLRNLLAKEIEEAYKWLRHMDSEIPSLEYRLELGGTWKSFSQMLLSGS